LGPFGQIGSRHNDVIVRIEADYWIERVHGNSGRN
jgi:hypothetical protein